MKSKSINDGAERTFVLILDQGEEAFKTITDFAEREKITGASVSAIGAFSKAKVGWFDLAAKKYKPIDVNEQCEVLSLIGDVRPRRSWPSGGAGGWRKAETSQVLCQGPGIEAQLLPLSNTLVSVPRCLAHYADCRGTVLALSDAALL